MKKTAKKLKPTLNPADVSLLIGAMKVVFPTREEVREIVKVEIKHLPTKEKFFARMDKLSGEYQKIDEAETLHAGKLSEHSDQLEKHDQRIKALEDRHKSAPTPVSPTM